MWVFVLVHVGLHLAACADKFMPCPCMHPVGMLRPCVVPLHAWTPSARLQGGIAEEHGQTPVQSLDFLAGSSRRGEAPGVATTALRTDALRAVRCRSRASWRRQDNMPWGAKLLGSPLKCLMRSDTYHLKSPACPRSRTTTGLLLISLRSLCWLLNNKHRRVCCD